MRLRYSKSVSAPYLTTVTNEYVNPPRLECTIPENTPIIKERDCEIRYYSTYRLRYSQLTVMKVTVFACDEFL